MMMWYISICQYVTSFGIKIGTKIWNLKHFLIRNYVANATSSYYIIQFYDMDVTLLWLLKKIEKYFYKKKRKTLN